MPKSVDFDEIVDEVESEPDDDFGSGIEAEAPDLESEVPADEPEAGEAEETLDEQPETVSLKSLAEKFQFQLQDSEDEVEALEHFFGETAKLRDWAQKANAERQQYQQAIQQYQHQLAQLQQQKPPEPQELPKPTELKGVLKHWENRPEWNQGWEKLIKRDADGNIVAVPGADPTLPQKWMQWSEWRDKAENLLYTNPQQFIYEALQSVPEFQAISERQQKQEEAFRAQQDWIEAKQLADQIRPFLKNADGSFNAAGHAFTEAVDLARQNGIHDAHSQYKLGLGAIRPYLEEMQAQPEEPPNKRKRQLAFSKNGARRSPNRGNTADKRQKAKSRPKDAVDMERDMLEQMKELGIDLDARVAG